MARFKTKIKPRPPRNTFPVWLIVTGIGLILLAAWALLSSINQKKAAIEVSGSPSIKVDERNFNYGDVKLGGSPIRTVVTVTNVGDKPLTFTEAPYIEVLEGC